MHLLFHDQLKKIKKKPFEWFGLALIVAVVSFTFMTVKPLSERLEAPIDDYLIQQNVEDFHIRVGMPDFNYLSGSQRFDLYLMMDLYLHPDFVGFNDRTASPYEMNQITVYVQEHIYDYPEAVKHLYNSMIQRVTDQYDITFELNYALMLEDDDYYFRVLTLNDTINLPYLVDGALPEGNQIAIFESFAIENDLAIGDALTIKGEAYEISGFVYAPDFLLPSLRSTSMLYDPTVETIVITSFDTMLGFREPFRVFYQGKGDFSALAGTFDITQIMQSDWQVFGRNMRMIESIVPQEYNPRIVAASFESQLTETFVTLFLGLFYALSVGLILLFIKRWIEHQKEDLIILSKLGYSKHQLARSLLMISMSLSVILVLFGLLGLYFSNLTFELYARRYLMPHIPFTVSFMTLFIGFFLPIVFINGFTYGYCLTQLTNIHKTQAMTRKKMRFKMRYLTLMRSLLLMFVSVLLLVSFLGRDLISDYQAQTLQGKHFESMVYLNHFDDTPRTEGEVFLYGNINLVAVNDTFLSDRRVVQSYGFKPDQTLYRLIDDKVSSNQLLESGVVVSTHFSVSEAINVGDELMVEVFGDRFTFTVVGVSDELVESALYFDFETLNRMHGFTDQLVYNGYFTNEAVSSAIGAFRIVNYRAIVEEVELLFTVTNRVITALMLLSSVLALFMFYYFIRGVLFEHLDTFLTLKAFGYLPHETFYVFFKKTFIEVFITYIFSFGLAYLFMQFALGYLYNALGFVFVLNIPYAMVFLGLVILISCVGFITVMVHRSVSNLPLSLVLKKA